MTRFLALTIAFLAACASIDLDRRPPESYDLTGNWRLVEDASGSPPSHRRLRARGGMLTFIVQDFPVLLAEEMRIEQSANSMGIRYDQRVYRDVSWGERRRGLWDVRAGWHEGDLYIISDAADADAREVFRLSDGGQRLAVEVRVESGGQDVHLTRVFRRE